jgi:hypothetical protein
VQVILMDYGGGAIYNWLAWPRACSHLRTTLHISLAILYRKYTGVHENDFTAHG